MRLIPVVCALLCVASLLPAVDTKTWEQNSMEDFDRGTLQHLSLSSDGRLSVAPRLREVYDASLAFLRTHSDHLHLPAEQRESVLRGVAGVIDSLGGRLIFHFTTVLVLTARSA